MSGFMRGIAGAVVVLLVALAAPAMAESDDTQRVIVKLRADAGEAAEVSEQLMAQTGGDAGAVFTEVLNGFAAEVPVAQLDELRADPAVAAVVVDKPITGANAEVPAGVRRIGAERVTGSKIGTRTNIDADIAILDTGINAHADLNIAGGTNCTLGNGCSGTTFADGHGHGTHVAGTAAAKDDGIGVVGTAPGARVWGVKVLGDTNGGYMSWFVAGLDWVVARGDIEVVNASLSGALDALTDQAIARATAAGVVVVVAAGNNSVDAVNTSPASSPNAITVSAYQDSDGSPGALGGGGDDTFASFSNYGSVVDVAAPGVFINSTLRTGGYGSMSGTSMASPHVAGAAAVYIVTNNLAASATRWQTVLDGFRGEWGAGQASTCGFTGGRSAEPVVIMGGCAGGDTVPPTAVGLTATAGDKQVSLTWTASSDASGIAAYRVYKATGATGAFSLLTTLPSTALSHVDTNLLNKTEYRYYVTAVDAAEFPNVSGPSFIRSATPADTVAPPVPVLTGNGFDKKVVLTWPKVTDPSGLKGYQLWRSTGGGASVLRASPSYSAVTYSDTMVLNDTSYRYTLRAVDKVGNVSGDSNAVTITPVDNMPPSVPSPSITVGDGKLSLKWSASKDTSGVASYSIYRATDLGSFASIATVSGTTLTYVDLGLTNYTTYRYYVTATDMKNQTSNPSAIKLSYPKDLTGPAAVTVSGSVSDGRADIAWSEASDVSGIGAYRVYRAMGTSATYSQVALLPPDAGGFTQTGLAAGTSYRYLVRAVDTKGNLGAVPTAAALTTPTTGLTIPTITHTAGAPGATTTAVTTVITLRSTSASAVPVASAKVAFDIRNGAGTTIATKTATSTTAGTVTIRLLLPRGATYRIVVTGITVVGRTWNGSTPTNSVAV